MSTSEYRPIVFNAIVEFVNELCQQFKKDQYSLKLYGYLIQKTTHKDTIPVQKHIHAFRDFCHANREALAEQNSSKLQEPCIVYSNKVYIDIQRIIAVADSDTVRIIWQHLLTIFALIEPNSNALELLQTVSSVEKGSDEQAFLETIMDKVQTQISPNTDNPLQAITALMQSGTLGDIVNDMSSRMESGSLDMSRLISSAHGILGQHAGDGNGMPSIDPQMMNVVMQAMSGGNHGDSEHVDSGNPGGDIGQIMQQMLTQSGGTGSFQDMIEMLQSSQTTPSQDSLGSLNHSP